MKAVVTVRSLSTHNSLPCLLEAEENHEAVISLSWHNTYNMAVPSC